MVFQRFSNKRKHRGFTLIELMIVIIVVAVLATIAVPGYSAYVRRGHRAEARAGLLQAAQWLERAATATGRYPKTLPAALTWVGDTSRRYNIGCPGCSSAGDGFELAATPRAGAQSGDECGVLTLDNTGLQGAGAKKSGQTGYNPSCWAK
ncbi:MAG: type IV pilin protein [Burkholderiaceae bacterium]|jgi:type IV pilus assembly protein PilE|nr:type IV pilin protein [Burkholderiaceae bacterium]